MRPGRAALYPGGDSGWRRTPGQASVFGSVSRCPQCGSTSQTKDEWGWDGAGEDGPSSYYYANVTGYPYGSAPTPPHTQQPSSRHSTYCPFCGQARSMMATTTSTTTYPQQLAGTQAGRAPAPAPARAEDNFFYDTGSYYASSYPAYSGYPREEWHTGSPGAPYTQFDNAGLAYQGPYSSHGTGPYGHYWQQQRHQVPYSPPPSATPYGLQSPSYPTMDAFDPANQGIPVGGYPYRIPGMGMHGAARRGMRGTCDLQPLNGTDKTVDFLSVEPIRFVPVHLQLLCYEEYWGHRHGLWSVWERIWQK
jgi:hypothetical protein